MPPQKNDRKLKSGVTKQTQQRQQARVQLRQTRRHDQVNKRRRGKEESEPQGPKEDFETRYAMDRLIKLVEAARGEARGATLAQLRMMIVDDNAPIDRFMQAGIMKVLTEVLAVPTSPGTPVEEFDALWCLTNIACDEYEFTKQVFSFAPRLVALLSSAYPPVQEQAAWCLANLAGEDAELRERLFEMKAVEPLVTLLAAEGDKLVQVAAWALVNLMKGPKVPVELFLQTRVIHLAGSRLTSTNDELLTEVLWVLANLVDADDERKRVVEAVAPHVPALLAIVTQRHDPLLLIPALHALAPVLRARPASVASLLPALNRGLENAHPGLAKETAVALAVFALEPSLLRELCGVAVGASRVFVRARFDIRKELAFFLLRAAMLSSSSSPSSPSPLLFALASEAGVVDAFLELLKTSDVDAILSGLYFTELILRQLPGGVKLIEERNGIELLETLQTSENEQLYAFARGIVDEFYGEDCEDNQHMCS